MKNRPLLFIVLSLLHLIEPLIKIFYFKAQTGFPFSLIMENIVQIDGAKSFFDFWLLFPLAGVALISVRKWSYPIFVGVQAYSIWNHLAYTSYTWPYVAKNPHLFSLMILSINVMIILYFMLPDVRRPFFDKDIRWWEHRVRYNMSFPISFTKGDPNKLYDAQVLNISLSGAFLDYQEHHVSVGDLIRVICVYEGESALVNAEVVSRHQYLGVQGIGIKFRYDNLWDNLAMRKVMRKVAHNYQKQKKSQPMNASNKMAA